MCCGAARKAVPTQLASPHVVGGVHTIQTRLHNTQKSRTREPPLPVHNVYAAGERASPALRTRMLSFCGRSGRYRTPFGEPKCRQDALLYSQSVIVSCRAKSMSVVGCPSGRAKLSCAHRGSCTLKEGKKLALNCCIGVSCGCGCCSSLCCCWSSCAGPDGLDRLSMVGGGTR